MFKTVIHSQLNLNGKPIEWILSEDNRSARAFLHNKGRYLSVQKVKDEINNMLNEKNRSSGTEFVCAHSKTLIIYDVPKIESILNESFKKYPIESVKPQSNVIQRQKMWVNYLPSTVQSFPGLEVKREVFIPQQLASPLQPQQPLLLTSQQEWYAMLDGLEEWLCREEKNLPHIESNEQLPPRVFSFFPTISFAYATGNQALSEANERDSILGKRKSAAEEFPEDMTQDTPQGRSLS